FASDRVMRFNKATRAVEEFASALSPGPLAVDDAYVYWGARTSDFKNILQRRAKTGGAIETLQTGTDGLGFIATNATHIFWRGFGSLSYVWRRAKSGGPNEIIATQDFAGSKIHADANHVYWLAMGTVWRIPTNQAAPVEEFAPDAPVGDF